MAVFSHADNDNYVDEDSVVVGGRGRWESFYCLSMAICIIKSLACIGVDLVSSIQFLCLILK